MSVMRGSDEEPAISVVIVDDHALLRAGTRQILERAGGFSVLGEASDGESALSVVAELVPDIVVLDVRLPDMNGVEVARRLTGAAHATHVVMLSAFDDADYVQACLGAGVSGYLLKTTPGDELVSALRAACSGVVVLDPRLPASLVGETEGRRHTSAGIELLTTRECEVLELVAEGLANKAIARHLGISPRTVEGHLNHVFDKVGASSRASLVRFALVNGLVDGS